MPAFRRSLTVLVAVVAVVVPALSASGSTADDLEAAKQRLSGARAAANEARALEYDAEVRLAQTQDRIADLEQAIADLKGQAAGLHDIVRRRALYAYTHAGNDIDLIIGTEDPLAAARGKALIDLSNEKDHTEARKLVEINRDHRDQTSAL